MYDEIILTCAVSGGHGNHDRHPDYPITPFQIARDCIDAARAGAAIAQAIGHEAVCQNHDVRFTSAAGLLGSLYAARTDGTFERKFKKLARIDLLIIDDFGLRPMKPPADEDFHDLIAERYERAATLVTSNLDFSEWGQAFANKLLGAATLDRLRHGAYQPVLDGNSYRRARDFHPTVPTASATEDPEDE
ncbi:MAG: hypothetical protein F4Z15_04550 [Gammaproteobacteria bacterium]|nr:hypothetical protein [Gammaproteobacteria bacterium]MYD76079.1 hypothetical protein [Gammaproteobacteria bacterium]MYJ52170.1 hypothetical protein [Gammaproteobacteria bacterium]